VGFKRNSYILRPRLAKLARCAVHTVEPLRRAHYGPVSVCGLPGRASFTRGHNKHSPETFGDGRVCGALGFAGRVNRETVGRCGFKGADGRGGELMVGIGETMAAAGGSGCNQWPGRPESFGTRRG
jgi:hypothetical protein